MSNEVSDKYVHGMDWGDETLTLSFLNNYRIYQFNLVEKFIGQNILEVGSGDRGFAFFINKCKKFDRLISVEPSSTLFNKYKNVYKFPENVKFYEKDFFHIKVETYGKFDTIIFTHVLEHLKDDRKALIKSYDILEKGGKVLIEVPALPLLFSVHDEVLGHYRRYTKKMLRNIIDIEMFNIEKLFYNDLIGVLGSFYFFKIRQIKINTDSGLSLVENQGMFYDKYIVPIEGKLEKFIKPPLGLSLTAVLTKI
ncbi:methyltransferase domain-containing protein [Bacteroidota bacterium]